MELALNEDEAVVLRDVLERYLPELREEVYKTEAFDMRQGLKRREEAIKALLSKLEKLTSVSR